MKRVRPDRAVEVLVVAASVARRTSLEEVAEASARLRLAGSSAGYRGVAARVAELEPEVVVIDLEEPEIEIPDLEAMIRGGLAVVLLAEDPEAEWVLQRLKLGVKAVLHREVENGFLQAAVEAAQAGLVTLDPEFAEGLAARFGGARRAEVLDELTEREREVLRMLAEGLGNREMAEMLGISSHTVKFHVSSILSKLGASSRTEAVSQGIRAGVIVV
jgi:DNA-binding NarL/FixJ family response regulator